MSHTMIYSIKSFSDLGKSGTAWGFQSHAWVRYDIGVLVHGGVVLRNLGGEQFFLDFKGVGLFFLFDLLF